MARELSVGDVLKPRASPTTMIRRGLAKHCPRCGGGGLFRGWFRMRKRCPSCGYQFVREEGFFLGAFIVNFVVFEVVLFAICIGYIAVHGAKGNDLFVSLALACACALVVPIVFFPFSRTLWSALDLISTPLELQEILEAAVAVGDGELAATASEALESAARDVPIPISSADDPSSGDGGGAGDAQPADEGVEHEEDPDGEQPPADAAQGGPGGADGERPGPPRAGPPAVAWSDRGSQHTHRSRRRAHRGRGGFGPHHRL